MTTPEPVPLIVLVVGAGATTRSVLAEAIPTGAADLAHVAELRTPLPIADESIGLCVVDDEGSAGEVVETLRMARRRWPTVGICCVRCRDVVTVLAAGADDAMPLDAPREVMVAQLKAALRRARMTNARLRVSFGDVGYDREARRVWCAGIEVSLTPRELRLFDVLFLRAGTPVSLDTLRTHVWNGDGMPESNALAVYVSYLRRKLRGSRLTTVETMRGVGYRLALAEGALEQDRQE